MEKDWTSTKMPELLVFMRALVLGFALAEIFRITYIGGCGLAAKLVHFDPVLRIVAVAIFFVLLAWYAISRGGVGTVERFVRSLRFDLLISSLLGVWANDILSSHTQNFHEHISKANPLWTLLIAALLLLMIVSSLTEL